VPTSYSSDGVDMMDSLDTDRDAVVMLFLSASSSSPIMILPFESSSAGSRRKSRGDPFPNEDAALLSFLHSSRRRSIETPLCNDDVVFTNLPGRPFGGGMVVLERSAATAAGIAVKS
jgi:hypothetical protein